MSVKETSIAGKQFGRLKAIKEDGRDKHRNVSWLCECTCGRFTKASIYNLRSGNTTSCGCYKDEVSTAMLNKNCVEGTNLNRMNMKVQQRTKSGHKGVYQKVSGKFNAYIGFQYKRIDLGTFDTIEEAIAARKVAEEKYYQPLLDKYKHDKERW